MTVDISPIVQALVATAGAVITGAVPLLTPWLLSHLRIASNTAAAQRVATGITAMAQLANSELASIGAHNANVDIKNKAVANAVAQASASFNKAAQIVGTTPQQVAKRVDGQLAALLGQQGVPVPSGEPVNGPLFLAPRT